MAKIHTVSQGEHLTSIAAANGFGTVDPIVNHPDNQELMKTRSPDVICPGDQITIPDRKPGLFTAAPGKGYTFIVRRTSVKIRVAFQNADGGPSANRRYRALYDGTTKAGTLDASGLLELAIHPETRRIAFTFEATQTEPAQDLELLVGALDPVVEDSGVAARLQNLGYLGAGSDQDEAAMRSAIEELQCEIDLAVDGVLTTTTRSKLVERHGV